MIKKKLTIIHSPWRRRMITVLLYITSLINKFAPRRARVHWVGYRRRKVRPERFMTLALFTIAMAFLTPYELAVWSVFAGGTAALFVIFATIYLLIPRKRQHWI